MSSRGNLSSLSTVQPGLGQSVEPSYLTGPVGADIDVSPCEQREEGKGCPKPGNKPSGGA